MARTLLVIALAAAAWGAFPAAAWAAPPAQEPAGTFDTLGEVLGALGLFAAMMLVLALGTEVVIDSFKILIGMKKKPTALEAFEQFKDELPGQLAGPGAGSVDLDAVWELLKGVEQRRFEVQSPLRKLWRWLRRASFPASAIVAALNWIRERRGQAPLSDHDQACRAIMEWRLGRLVEWIERLYNFSLGRTPPGKALDQPRPIEKPTPQTLARLLFELADRHADEEKSRLRWLRLISVVIGVYLAYLLQVDAIKILVGATPIFNGLAGVNRLVDTPRVLAWLNPPWLLQLLHLKGLVALAPGLELNAGILISGLAASAGSAYWHDILGRLQAARTNLAQVEKLAGLVKPAQEE